MRYIVEELSKVEQEDIPLLAVLPVMLLEMLGQTPHSKVITFPIHRRTVVVDECPGEHRHDGIIAQASLNDTLTYDSTPDVSVLTTLVQIELVEARRLVLPGHEPIVGVQHIQRSLRYVPLHTGFPRYIAPAALVGLVQMGVAENLGIIISCGRLPHLRLVPFFHPAPVSCLSSFFTRHFLKLPVTRTAAGWLPVAA